MRLDYNRFESLLTAAAECLDAYERLVAALCGELPQSTNVARDLDRLIHDVTLRPNMDAILVLKYERRMLDENRDRLERNREAVNKSREKKREGVKTVTRKEGRVIKAPQAPKPQTIVQDATELQPTDIYSSEEYDEIVRRAMAEGAAPLSQSKDEPESLSEEPPAPEPQPLIDATPTRGTDLAF